MTDDLQILTGNRGDIARVWAWTRGSMRRPTDDVLARVHIVTYTDPAPLSASLDAMVWTDDLMAH